ncbi:unnamed protein product [Closterium sp. NIES-54]
MPCHVSPSVYVPCSLFRVVHGAWGMGHGAWDMGHGAWDMGVMVHGALGAGHGVWGMGNVGWCMGNVGWCMGAWGITGAACAIGEQPIKGLINPAAMARMAIGEALTNLVWAKVGPCDVVAWHLASCAPWCMGQPWRSWPLGRPSPTLCGPSPRNHASTAAMAQMAVGRSLSNLVWAKVGWCGMGCCDSQLIPAGSRIQMYAVKMGAAGATMTRITVEIVSSSGNNYCRSHEHVSSLLEATSCIPIPAF